MTCVLEADAISFSYGRRRILSGATLAVHSGEITALVGPNGAGKTTLLKVLAGLLVPDAGRLRRPGDRAATVAYLAQSEELPADFTVREVIELGRLPYVGWWRALRREDSRVVRETMDRARIELLADRLIATLSGGERQRVALARALAQEPAVLLLDEPTVHLDLRCQLELFSTMRAEADRGVGVVAVMHDLTHASQADRCVLLADGRIRAIGRPGDVLVPALLREVFEAEVELLQAQNGRAVLVPVLGPASNTRGEEGACPPIESC
jgi:iron complex transport system ATP-binding protein